MIYACCNLRGDEHLPAQRLPLVGCGRQGSAGLPRPYLAGFGQARRGAGRGPIGADELALVVVAGERA